MFLSQQTLFIIENLVEQLFCQKHFILHISVGIKKIIQNKKKGFDNQESHDKYRYLSNKVLSIASLLPIHMFKTTVAKLFQEWKMLSPDSRHNEVHHPIYYVALLTKLNLSKDAATYPSCQWTSVSLSQVQVRYLIKVRLLTGTVLYSMTVCLLIMYWILVDKICTFWITWIVTLMPKTSHTVSLVKS